MQRQNYYPSRIAAQVSWLENYATKLSIHAPNLSLPTADTGGSMDDAHWCRYVLGMWLPAVRSFSPSSTDAVDAVLTGTGTTVLALPTFTAPPVPSGTVPRLPGALPRIFSLVARIKLDAAYTEAMGQDLGIVGQEATGKPLKFTASVVQGSTSQCAKLTFFKYSHLGVYIESKRGTGDWAFLGIDTESPYLDERPLAVAGTPEVRSYRMRFWDKGTPNGDWTDVASVTVAP